MHFKILRKLVTILLIAAALSTVYGVNRAMAMSITIQVEVNGITFPLDVEPGDTIDQIKAKIQDSQGFLPDQQILVYQNEVLLDGRTLADYEIGKDATIRLVFRQAETAFVGTAQAPVGATNVLASFTPGHACTGANLSVTKVSNYPGFASNPGEMPIYWIINSDCTGEFSLALTLCYSAEELGNANSVTEANLVIFKNPGDTTWTNQGGIWDSGSQCVTLAGVSELSSWTLADPSGGAPNVVIASQFSASQPANRMWVVFGAGLILAGGALLLRKSGIISL